MGGNDATRRGSGETTGVRIVEVDNDRAGQRIDNFLTALLKGVPRTAVYRMIRTGQVRINGGRCRAATRVAAGDQVRIPPVRVARGGDVSVPAWAIGQLEAAELFINDDVVVVNKPAGMAVHAGSGLEWGLIDAVRQSRPGEFIELAHRLDRETSGCLVLARSGPALNHLSAQFREGRVSKHYLALLGAPMPEAQIVVDLPLATDSGTDRQRVRAADDGKPALTRFRLLQQFADCSYVEVELLTGRKHQIRAHAHAIGLPLAGDGMYAGKGAARLWRKRGLKRLFLHAHRLGLTLPSGEEMLFEAPLPPELRAVLDRLES
jgi:23S rRNA pseudouridine955/2504/2580 synthase